MAKGNIGKHPWNWKGGRTVTQAGYVLIFVGKSHPIADVRGYAYEHRLKAYNAGHDIDGKHVHHEDEVKSNNEESNLKPLTPFEHRAEHRKSGSRLRLPGEPNPTVKCGCGCGSPFLKYDEHNRPRAYVSGHNNDTLRPFCSCECGSRMARFNPRRVGKPQYLHGHKPPPVPKPNPLILCVCGCGTEFPQFDQWQRPRQYLPGHNRTGQFSKGHAYATH